MSLSSEDCASIENQLSETTVTGLTSCTAYDVFVTPVFSNLVGPDASLSYVYTREKKFSTIMNSLLTNSIEMNV